jgi:hypothetical protein
MTPTADNPASQVIDKANRLEPAWNRRHLQMPVASAILGTPNRTPITNRPAMIRIQEEYIRQFCVGKKAWGQPRRLTEPRVRNRQYGY